MIQQESILQVADNSGAKTVKCIKVLGGYKKKNATLGDILITSIQELRNKSKITSKVKKGEIYKALVVRIKKTLKKKNGTIISCNKRTKKNNAIILINKKGNPIKTKVTEQIPFKPRKNKTNVR
jgi:large subunit ribosomal protein L14